MDGSKVIPPESKVAFRNVAGSYVPGTALECRYTLPPKARWASKDWIGLFRVGWRSARDYYTFVWSPAPQGHADRSSLNCCVRFEASYLPGDGSALYQFCYLGADGAVRGMSPAFTFCRPKPEDDLVVLEELESNSDMLLVVTRTSLLETQLAKSEQRNQELAEARKDLEGEARELKARVRELEASDETSRCERSQLLEQRQLLLAGKRDAESDRQRLQEQQAESAARIRDLEAEVQTAGRTLRDRAAALDRARDRIMKLTGQQEEMGKQAQDEMKERQLIQAQVESLRRENRTLRDQLSERIGEVASLNQEIQRLQQRLALADKHKVKYDAVSEQLRQAREQLSSGRQEAQLMGEELSRAASVRDRTMTELHRSRLQSAELEVKLAEASRRWEEAEGRWLEERSDQRQHSEMDREKVLSLTAELLKWKVCSQERESETERLKKQLNREQDCSRVQLSEMLRERKEMKSALGVAQKEKELLQNENGEILEYVKALEWNLEQAKRREVSKHPESSGGSPRTAAVELRTRTAEDRVSRIRETPSDAPDHTKSRGCGSLSPRQTGGLVVISQPVAIVSQLAEAQSEIGKASSWDDTASTKSSNLPIADPEATSDAAVRSVDPKSPQRAAGGLDGDLQEGAEENSAGDTWKECPICKQRFPEGYGKQALERHIDSHFFLSTNDPFTFQ